MRDCCLIAFCLLGFLLNHFLMKWLNWKWETRDRSNDRPSNSRDGDWR